MDTSGISTPIGAYTSSYAMNAAERVTKKMEEAETQTQTAAAASGQSGEAAVYEPSKKVTALSESQINQMKSDLEARMQEIVRKALSQQAGTYNSSIGLAEIFGKDGLLEKGLITVDEETQKEAQESISEDGYWGVEKTSERLVQYATALTGGDPDKIDTMIEAVKKGFEEAEKAWGGELPSITKQTYDATMEKFENLKKQSGLSVAGTTVA